MLDFKTKCLVVVSLFMLHSLQASYSQPHSRTGSIVCYGQSPVARSHEGWGHVLRRGQTDMLDHHDNQLEMHAARLKHIEQEIVMVKHGMQGQASALIPLLVEFEVLKKEMQELADHTAVLIPVVQSHAASLEQLQEQGQQSVESEVVVADGSVLNRVQSQLNKNTKNIQEMYVDLLKVNRQLQYQNVVQLFLIGIGSLYVSISTVVAIIMFTKS